VTTEPLEGERIELSCDQASALCPTRKSTRSPQMTTGRGVAISVSDELARELIDVGTSRSGAEFVEREWMLEMRG
jgi:hypothetical protein